MKGVVRWTLDEAVTFARRLEEFVSPTWHVGLTGSVLYRGESAKDLDLIVYPHNASHARSREWSAPSGGGLREALLRAGLRLVCAERDVRQAWREAGSSDTKRVSVWVTSEGRRVDVFRLR